MTKKYYLVLSASEHYEKFENIWNYVISVPQRHPGFHHCVGVEVGVRAANEDPALRTTTNHTDRNIHKKSTIEYIVSSQ